MINNFRYVALRAAQGFTLVETLVAVTILVTALAGPLTIASKGLQATLLAKDQDTAYYLAQDAIEYIRWVRDTNKLKGDSNWLAGLDGSATVGNYISVSGSCVSLDGSAKCIVDSSGNPVDAQGHHILDCGATCSLLGYDTGKNLFSYTAPGANATIFRRTVSIILDGTGHEAMITVSVAWSDQVGSGATAISRSVTVRENIFDWQ